MRQRTFPWMQTMSPPTDAPMQVVAQVTSYGQAARVALAMKSGCFTESWLASRLGISRGYFSRILNDVQPMPRWMFNAISWATGSRIVEQYDEMLVRVRVVESGRDVVERLANLARAA